MKDYVDTVSAAAILELTRHTVSELCKQGSIPAIKMSGHWIIHRSDLNRFQALKRPVGNPNFSTKS